MKLPHSVLSEGLDVPLVACVEEDGTGVGVGVPGAPVGVVDQVALLVEVVVRQTEVVDLEKGYLIFMR